MNLHSRVYKLLQFFPQVAQWKDKKVRQCLKELFDIVIDPKELAWIISDIYQVQHLVTLPKVPQRSPEWFDLRKNRLTASDLAQALGKGKFGNRETLVLKKAFPDKFPFITMAPLKWGTMFEDMGMRCYQQNINKVKLYDFGLIPHPDIDCFGASPDGITETGIMVEMKCPYSRVCDDQVPEQYYLQIQGQLATCDLHYCDYIECYFDTFNDLNEYKILCHDLTVKNHGIILEFSHDNSWSYLYSPEGLTVLECMDWANAHAGDKPGFVKMTPWKLRHIFHKSVAFNPDLWSELVPKIIAFWEDVEKAKVAGFPEKVESKSSFKGQTLDMRTEKKYRFIEDTDTEED